MITKFLFGLYLSNCYCIKIVSDSLNPAHILPNLATFVMLVSAPIQKGTQQWQLRLNPPKPQKRFRVIYSDNKKLVDIVVELLPLVYCLLSGYCVEVSEQKSVIWPTVQRRP